MSADVSAQVQWKGHDYNELVSSSGTEVFLYNVGTGRFLIHGGDWGIQARLFYNNNGKVLTLKYGQGGNNIIFDTGMTTQHNGQYANNLGCNPPGVTTAGNWYTDTDWKDGPCYSVIMDSKELIGDGSARNTYRNWHFIRVEDPSNTETYTYYMYETLGRQASAYYAANTNFYMGAVYGENGEAQDGIGHEKDPIGKLALLSSSYDKVTWTTVDPRSTTSYPNGLKSAETAYLGDITSIDRSMSSEVRIYGDVDIELRKLYQWRIVTKAELVKLATSQEDTGSGLNINLTYLIQDRGMERNDFAFFEGDNTNQDNAWIAKPFTDNIYSTDGEGRHRYTWGYLSGVKSTSNKTLNTATSPLNVDGQNYKYPVRLKAQWDNKIDAKYGYMEFEGVGTASTYIEAPAAGTYKIVGYGFYSGNPAYLFATTADPATLSLSNLKNGNINEFQPVTYDYDKSAEGSVTKSGNTYTKTGVMGGGYDFVYNKTDYRREVEINVNQGDKIYLGVAKFDATRSASDASSGGTTTTYCYITYTSDGTTYYLNHNARFVAVDGEPTSDYQWLLQRYNNYSDYYYVYYMNGTRQTWLVASSNSASTSTSTSNRLYYYNGRIVDDRNDNYNTYYLKGTTSSTTAPSVTSGTSGAATARTETVTTGGTSYYHDTDWVGVDQFEITYLGTDPVMFDEDEESLDYLKKDDGDDKQYTNQAVRLHRTFAKNEWNSFAFPLNLSSDQVRNAFGDETRLAVLDGLGTISGNKGIIDFRSIQMSSETAAVEAGHFYIVKPENDPLETSGGKSYYALGRGTFNTNEFAAIDEQYAYDKDKTIAIKTHATYVANTPVLAGSYVMGKRKSDGKFNMFYLTSGTTIKGFRGWITDEDEVLSKRSMPISFDGVYDETDNINELIFGSTPSIGDNIYDVSGRKVGAVEDNVNLPKGLYIVNGKKFIVK